jgi:soluble lytic murein transglycosylase-like protein
MKTLSKPLSTAIAMLGILFGLMYAPLSGYADIVRHYGADGRVYFTNVTPTRSLSPAAPVAVASARAALLPVISRLARHYDVDARLVQTIIAVESAFNPNAVSHAGAQGLMQLMPATAARYEVGDPFDPHANIEGGIRYLRDLFQRFPSDLQRVLAAYNAGEAAVERYGGVPPYPETQHYVTRVMTLYGRDAWPPQKIYRYQTASGSILFTNVPR